MGRQREGGCGLALIRMPQCQIYGGASGTGRTRTAIAVYAACSGGHIAILERLKPDPSLDDYEELYRCARNKETVELLARSKPPANPSWVVVIQLSRAAWSFRQDRPVETLQALFEASRPSRGDPHLCARADGY